MLSSGVTKVSKTARSVAPYGAKPAVSVSEIVIETPARRRQADVARDGRREDPKRGERRRQTPGVAPEQRTRRAMPRHASRIAPDIRATKPARSRWSSAVACAAGVHSSKWRRLTNSRQSVRAMASAHQTRLIGEKVEVQRRQRIRPTADRPPSARIWLGRTKRRDVAHDGGKHQE